MPSHSSIDDGDLEPRDAQSRKVGLAAGDATIKIHVDGVERSFLVHTPPDLNPDASTPIVFVFHGGGTNPNWVKRFCGLTKKGDEAGFLTVFPSGTGQRARRLSWNFPGSGYGRWAETVDGPASGPDEVQFVRAIVDELERRTCIDRRRIYASGASTGAIMVYFLASRMANEIAAIAPVGGPMGDDLEPPSRPVSIIHFHGTDDDYAPYDGGQGEQSFTGLEFKSVDETIEKWAEFNGCEDPPEVLDLPQVNDKLLSIRRTTYVGRAASEIVLYTIFRGGHTWPGQDPRVGLMGRFTEDIVANDLIWDFFLRHPLPKSPQAH